MYLAICTKYNRLNTYQSAVLYDNELLKDHTLVYETDRASTSILI